MMGQRIRLSWRRMARMRLGEWGGLFRFVARYVDLLIVPWFLEPIVVWIYVSARVASLCIPLTLFLLGSRVARQLSKLAQAQEQSGFQSAAARVNLSYLMVCGAMALFVMVGAPNLAVILGTPKGLYSEILVWLVVGQSAPVLFGATGLLMHAVERGAFYDMLLGLTALLFLAATVLFDVRDGVMVAQALVAAQMTQAGLCALLLTQCGVWPGLTSLLHKEIKLF
ncbi:hypothetical protein [Sulfitobacter sp.]|uniref:hypothetical protein n=1 Tax=Sulfitobacter sp. TaxID=1903071 RepID=UPI003003521E